MIAQNEPGRFTRNLIISAGLVVLLAILFGLYTRSVRQVEHANEVRHRSFLLAEELRQSAGDLTRMARGYVATRDPIYKRYYRDILDIRDGKKPRPKGYGTSYWDLVVRDGREPEPGEIIPFHELMRQAGFTEEEFRKLADAKASSDALAAFEMQAMELADSAGPDTEADWAHATTMLYDADYFTAKFAIMKAISEFHDMMDARTLSAIGTANNNAAILRAIHVVIGLTLMFMLWRTYAALGEFMGGTVREVSGIIGRIGREDFSTPIAVRDAAKTSVLGRLAGMQTKLQDNMRERERADDELREREVRYRRLFESAKDGILILDAESGDVIDANPFLIHLLGYSHSAFLGKKIYELGPFKDFIQNLANFEELQREEYIRYEDQPLEAADGRHVDVEFVSNVYMEGEQKVIQCNIRDITDRKRADRALSASEGRLRQTARSGNVGLSDWDLQTNKVAYSPEWKRQLGFEDDEITDSLDEFGSRLHPDDHESVMLLANAFATHQATSLDAEFRLRHKDGSYRWFLTQGELVVDDEGRSSHVLVTAKDITEFKKLEERFHQAEKLEAVGRLAGGIAHDFNNVLSVIIGYSDLALKSLPEGDPLRDEIQAIRLAGERASTIVRQLLAFSRKEVQENRVVDPREILAEEEKMLARMIAENIEVIVKCDDDVGRVKVDPGQLERVIMNLALNAQDAMPNGGKLVFELRNADLDETIVHGQTVVIPGSYVMLSVSDNGAGMDKETLDKIYDPFFTTKEVGKGTGLGLSSAYGIINQCGGYIFAYSELGHGTTIKIYLPRADEQVSPVTTGTPSSALDAGTETILFVEDNDPLRELGQRILRSGGYTVLPAASAEEALSVINGTEFPIHLLVTDVIMPGMSGAELAERACDIRPELKVIFMSGYPDSLLAPNGVLREGTQFIGKPFSAVELTRKVREVLSRQAPLKAVPIGAVASRDAETSMANN